MALTFPYGYKEPPNGGPAGMGTMLTWDQMMTKTTVNRLHPEVLRRFKGLIEYAASQGVPLGVGGGWRVQPNPPPPGFAKPGNSWHESCPTLPASPTALAIDTVPSPSWPWMENNCARWGFRTFKNVNSEPWHVQPIEVSTSRKYATVLPSLQTWPLPGVTPPTTKPPPGTEMKDDEAMFIVQANDGSPEVWLTNYLWRRHINMEEYTHYHNLWVMGFPYFFDGGSGKQIMVDPDVIYPVPIWTPTAASAVDYDRIAKTTNDDAARRMTV